MKMTPEVFTERLKALCGTRLKSVILFGSAASGEHAGKRSDYNLLVVLERLAVRDLQPLAEPIRAWVKAGNPPPLLFTPHSLERARGVFALELADIRDAHRLLAGEDLIASLAIDVSALRAALERELNGKLMQLRARYLLVQGRPRAVIELMVRSLSTFMALCRGALRLYQSTVPSKQSEVLSALAAHVPLEARVFDTIRHLKLGRKIPGLDPDELFAGYLQEIERLVDAVDAHLHR